jgi:diguanylate cyclase (GGDEF)-like protein
MRHSAVQTLRGLAAWCALAGVLAPAWANTSDVTSARANVFEQADRWLRVGYDEPERALKAIDHALALAPDQGRLWQRTRALVAARAGRDERTAQAIESLQAMAQAGDALAAADADLARAIQAERRGQTAQSADYAQSAHDRYERLCGAAAPSRTVGCDHRTDWLALNMLRQRDTEDGDLVAAAARADACAQIAQRANDGVLQAWSLAALATLRAKEGKPADAQRLLAQAEALLQGSPRRDVQARVSLLAATAATSQGDRRGVMHALERARTLAQAAASPRLEALVLSNLSDALLHGGRAGEALVAVQAALPTVRRHDDRRLERVLLHNGALALIGLGRVAEARAQADRMLELWAAEGTLGEQAMALREVADALADAGQARAALDLYHRERTLNTTLVAGQRDSAERSLRVRYDRDSEQRRIELMARDNAIANAELDNQVLTQRLWTLAAAVVAATALLIGLLLQRVRATQRSLERSQAQLRVQSEHDALTGLANRRCGQLRMAEASDGAMGYRGALLLVDVDHFKRVNDEQGHAAGDQVLVEVARRLAATVRDGDLLVRWGGEEFLVIVPQVERTAVDALGERLLQAVAGEPVQLAEGKKLTVTVSVGYGSFPLAPRHEAISWERALNLADMALYTAKSQGRNRAMGLGELADTPDALAVVERDFERAWTEGLVRLTIQPGPGLDGDVTDAANWARRRVA